MANPDISLLGATYSGVKGVTLPKQGGGTATFPWVEGSETKTANGTYDVTNLAQLVVNVSGGPSETHFVVTFALDENDGLWKPDCTWAQMQAAVAASKTIIAVPYYTEQSVTGDYDSETPAYYYMAVWEDFQLIDGTTTTVTRKGFYHFDSSGVTEEYVATYIYLPTASKSITTNGTYDVTKYASAVVNVSGGGSDRLVLLKTTALGALSTSSTSAADTGKTVSLASSTGWAGYDFLLVDISVDTVTNGRHTSTVTPVILTGTSNVSTKNTYTVGSNAWNSKVSSNGTASTRQSTTKYGVYINAASVSSNTLTLTVYYRYNSNSTGTLNGSYTARVYGIKLIDLIGG